MPIALAFALAFAMALVPASAQTAPASSSAASSSSSSSTSTAKKPAAKKKSTKHHHSSSRQPSQKAPLPDRISEIQTALSRDGYYTGNPNGKWDASTVAALQKFQSAQGLDATGKLDARSLQRLGLGSDVAGVSAPVAPPPPSTAAPASHPASQPPAPQPPAGTQPQSQPATTQPVTQPQTPAQTTPQPKL
jgi:peptidoglycan hydrolase-like protein with peptidoglycan-binding domain